jgi:hypothetical protein
MDFRRPVCASRATKVSVGDTFHEAALEEYLHPQMTDSANPAELVDCKADERLLSEDLDNLPDALGRPQAIPPSRARRRIVGTGAALTGASLIIGVALAVLGAIEVIASGIDLTSVLALVLGVVLIATHWGWVHVAELTANTIEGRTHAEIVDRRREWLGTIEPYTRFEVSTGVDDDGSIIIECVRHRPVRSGPHSFTFAREIEEREVHSADEGAAVVSERAELLRRQAALATERERERYEVAADAYDAALAGRADDEQRRLAQRAASEALSQQINSNLRDPPLVE